MYLWESNCVYVGGERNMGTVTLQNITKSVVSKHK